VEAADRGETEAAIADRFDINRKTVRLWKQRFAQDGLPGLWEFAPPPPQTKADCREG
jgi:transposase